MIPYGQHTIDQDDLEAVVEVLRSKVITQGSKVEEFGNALAKYTGATYGVPVSSGTTALQLAVSSLDIGRGDEVISTPLTFCATTNSVLHQGADIRLVDIDEKTLNMDPNRIEAAVNENTKAIIPVDFRGHPAELPEIWDIARKYGLAVIEDASHALGSIYSSGNKQYRCGDGIHADLSVFSFHPVKHITTGEGGAVLTNSEKLFEKIVRMRSHGLERKQNMLNESKRAGPWVYDMFELGSNCRLSDFQAALGLSQLNKIDAFRSRRRQIVNYYNERLAGIEELTIPYESDYVDSNFHLYVLQIRENPMFDRYDFFEALKKVGYSPMVHYIPVHLLSYYAKKYGFRRGDFPIAERYYDSAITIPLFPSLSDADIDKVVNDIRFIIERLS